MTPELATLINAGCQLSPEDRFELAHQMLVSAESAHTTGRDLIDEPRTNIDSAWTAEISDRIDAILNGEVATVPFSETYTMLRAELDARRA